MAFIGSENHSTRPLCGDPRATLTLRRLGIHKAADVKDRLLQSGATRLTAMFDARAAASLESPSDETHGTRSVYFADFAIYARIGFC